MERTVKYILMTVLALAAATPASAEDAGIVWTLKGAKFDPSPLAIEAKGDFVIKFVNTNATAAELECKDLKIEKPVVANGTILVRVLNPKPGTYDCVDEPHEDVAKAQIVIK